MTYIAKWVFILFSLLLMMVFTPASTPPSIAAAAGPPDNLEKLHQRMLPVFEIEGVVYTDANEQTNRLVVAVQNKGLARSIEQRLKAEGIPLELVDIIESEPIVQLTTLRDNVRPLEGGLQIQFSNYLCTYGFNATRGGVAGFVTASHCTNKQGGTEGTLYYQPGTSSTTFIGTEAADPTYFRGGVCPKGKKCRYSDSAFAALAAGVTSDLGYIEKTDSMNNGSLNIAGSFHIVSEGASVVGDTVNKVGRTTGWTQGKVTNTCVNTGVSGTNIVQLCQDFVSAGVQGGDSGSNVFAITSGNDVQLRGILWGGNKSGTQFVYSPIANVEQSSELGVLQTY